MAGSPAAGQAVGVARINARIARLTAKLGNKGADIAQAGARGLDEGADGVRGASNAAGVVSEAAGEATQQATTTATRGVPRINPQKQAGHIPGTPQHKNRLKQGKDTSSFFGKESGERATQIAHQRGTPVPGRPNVKEYDFGASVGTGPKGGAQTRVRVHESPKTGEIQGHPAGPEQF